jgi:branched-chain amino acid transport system substrate-binding protein
MGLIFKIIGILLLIVCWLAIPSAQAAENSLQIAIAAPFSGEQSEYGNLIWQGANIAVENLNKAGGILGLPLTLVKINHSCDSNSAPNLLNQLNNQHAVVAVLGHVCSSGSIVSLNNYAKTGKLLITPISSNTILLRHGHYTFFSLTEHNDSPNNVIILQSQAATEAVIQALLHSKTYSGNALATWLHYNQVHTSLGKLSWDTNGSLYQHRKSI